MQAPMVREAVELARARGLNGFSPAMVEGFAASKVLAEALRRARARPIVKAFSRS